MDERNSNGSIKGCPQCKGHGFIYGSSMLLGGTSCPCRETFLRSRKLDTIWESLSRVDAGSGKTLPASLAKSCCRITSTRAVFQQHLKRFVLTQPEFWSCKVRTDAELLDAWLATAKAQGAKIFDLDVSESEILAIDIPSLVMPPDLCILWMGVKNLPNKEAPNSLMEAISYRSHVGKPTWIIDQPTKKLDGTHLYYSREFDALSEAWPHLTLTKTGVDIKKKKNTAAAVMELAEPMESEEEDPVQVETVVTSKYVAGLISDLSKRETKRKR